MEVEKSGWTKYNVLEMNPDFLTALIHLIVTVIINTYMVMRQSDVVGFDVV